MELLRRDLGDEVEFVTIMWFDSMDAVRAFAGEDYEKAVVPDAGLETARSCRRDGLSGKQLRSLSSIHVTGWKGFR